MIYNQINIAKDNKKFPYTIEYVDTDYNTSDLFQYGVSGDGSVCFYNTDNDVVNLIRSNNEWYINDLELSTDHLPKSDSDEISINMSNVRLYFPLFSVDTYAHTKYCIKLSTYINGCEIVLASYLIDRNDAAAIHSGPKLFKNRTYYEYIDLSIVDPWYVAYSDDWAEFRNAVCHEPTNINNTGSIIYVELNPITAQQDNSYIVTDGFVGGSSSILFSNKPSDSLRANLHCNCFDNPNAPTYTEETSFVVNVEFNDAYNGDFATYLEETYGIVSSVDLVYELVLKDSENIYKYISYSTTPTETYKCFTKQELGIQSWAEYVSGLEALATITIRQNGEDILIIYTNPLPITSDIFKFLINTNIVNEDMRALYEGDPDNYIIENYNVYANDGGAENPKKGDFVTSLIINSINTQYVDMNNYNIDVVNKIKQTVVNVSRPDDYKSNILKPIFVQSYKSSNIVVHPLVSENISINLDSYKQSVDIFYLRIENQDFVEIGRTGYGVVFKVVGKMLPNEVTSGIYYILDSNKDLVTTGNYIYEQ